MKGKIMALATIGAVVALSIVAASLWVPQGPITFDEERYRLGESIFMKVRDLQTMMYYGLHSSRCFSEPGRYSLVISKYAGGYVPSSNTTFHLPTSSSGVHISLCLTVSGVK